MPVFFIQSNKIFNNTVTIDNPLLFHLSKSLRIREGEKIGSETSTGFEIMLQVTHLDSKSLQASILETIAGTPQLHRPQLYWHRPS